jgi:hypothetical protein
VAEVVGADIDPAVLTNDEVDSAVIIDDSRLPFPDESFDLVFSCITRIPPRILGYRLSLIAPSNGINCGAKQRADSPNSCAIPVNTTAA